VIRCAENEPGWFTVSNRRERVVTSSIPWQLRLSTSTEDIQDEVIGWYQQTRHGKAYVPNMIWGTLQTEAYATVILCRVVDFLEVPDDVPAGVAKRMER